MVATKLLVRFAVLVGRPGTSALTGVADPVTGSPWLAEGVCSAVGAGTAGDVRKLLNDWLRQLYASYPALWQDTHPDAKPALGLGLGPGARETCELCGCLGCRQLYALLHLPGNGLAVLSGALLWGGDETEEAPRRNDP